MSDEITDLCTITLANVELSVLCFSAGFSACNYTACHVPKRYSTPCGEQTECYFFNQELAQCQAFDGCPVEGSNNFDTLADCHETCGGNGVLSI